MRWAKKGKKTLDGDDKDGAEGKVDATGSQQAGMDKEEGSGSVDDDDDDEDDDDDDEEAWEDEEDADDGDTRAEEDTDDTQLGKKSSTAEAINMSNTTSSTRPAPSPTSPDLPPISPTSPIPQRPPPHSRTSSSATAIFHGTIQPNESPSSDQNPSGTTRIDVGKAREAEPEVAFPDTEKDEGHDKDKEEEKRERGKSSQSSKVDQQKDESEDSDDWVDATLSPSAISPGSAKEDGSWQVI